MKYLLVRRADGLPEVTAGPYLETKELEMSGDAGAAAAYRDAAGRTTSVPERRYLTVRAQRLTGNLASPAV